MKEKNEKPKLTIKIGRCIEGMNLVIPEHCSREERERLESEYQKFCQRIELEKDCWIFSLPEFIPLDFKEDVDFELEIEGKEAMSSIKEDSITIEMKELIKNMKEEGKRFKEASDAMKKELEDTFLRVLATSSTPESKNQSSWGKIEIEFFQLKRGIYIREVRFDGKRIHYDIIPSKIFFQLDDDLQKAWKRYDPEGTLTRKQRQTTCNCTCNSRNRLGFFRKIRLKFLKLKYKLKTK